METLQEPNPVSTISTMYSIKGCILRRYLYYSRGGDKDNTYEELYLNWFDEDMLRSKALKTHSFVGLRQKEQGRCHNDKLLYRD